MKKNDIQFLVVKNVTAPVRCGISDAISPPRGKGWAARPAHGLISVEHAQKVIRYRNFKSGGDGGIRTLDTPLERITV